MYEVSCCQIDRSMATFILQNGPPGRFIQPPEVPGPDISATIVGAIIGGVLGAIGGSLFFDRPIGGAVAGAATGAVIGSTI